MNVAKARAITTWSALAAAILVPLAVTLVGWWAQASIARDTIRREYVQIAVGILSTSPSVDPKESEEAKKQRQQLRTWAVDLLAHHSPIDLSAAARDGLISGESTISPVMHFQESADGRWRVAPQEPEAQTLPFEPGDQEEYRMHPADAGDSNKQ